MKRRIYAFISVLVLAGCTQNHLATELPALEGQPVSQAVHYLGQPTEEKKTDGGRMYSWVNDQSGTFYVPETSSSPVVIQNGGRPTVAFSEPTAPAMPDTYNWHCRLDITAEKGVIVHTTYQGNAGGCQVFSDKLKALATVGATGGESQ